SYDSGVVTISWDKNSASDFAYYNIYRSKINNFEPDSTNYYSIVDTAFFQDTTSITNGKLYYRITAVDSWGNESVPGDQITVTITGIDEGEVEVVGEYKLYQNFPNPFNPTTIIPFKLKERAYVKVMVYDIKGEMLKVLVNETKEAGYYATEFDGSNFASGIYLYRIEVIGQGTIPVYMEMKKMILIK
ncbi:MAG: T9SS type A sorting domain-containing protein, partial [Ignavibacterium sp.]|nr:T9SS type A sorting domain-containing protein [Ignavibacterium sp.]